MPTGSGNYYGNHEWANNWRNEGSSGEHGADNNEMSLEEIEQQKQEFMKAYGNQHPWRWGLAVLGAMIGGIIGTGIAMYFVLGADPQLDPEPIVNGSTVELPPSPPAMIQPERAQFLYSLGLLLGTLSGLLLTMAYMGVRLIIYHKNDPFKKHVQQMREVIRKKEQLRIERHDEVVYYDAGEAHGCCFSCFCRPHYGKITSERVIYSAEPSAEDAENTLQMAKKCCNFLPSLWQRKVESVDIEHMLDVSVSQSCMQMITNVGDVTIHLVAGSDTSILKDERDKLLNALAVDTAEKKQKLLAKDEETVTERIQDLKTALHTARDLPELRHLVQTAENEVRRLVEIGRTVAREKSEEYFEPHPRAQNKAEQQDTNSSNKVVVKDVKRPYMVLDTMSYKIAKQINFTKGGQTKAQRKTLAAEAAYDVDVGLTQSDAAVTIGGAGVQEVESDAERARRKTDEFNKAAEASQLQVGAAQAQEHAAGAMVQASAAQGRADEAQRQAERQAEEARRTGGKARIAPAPPVPGPQFPVAGTPVTGAPGQLPPVKAPGPGKS